MKTNLLPGQCLIKQSLSILVLLLMNMWSSAQNKKYAGSEIHQISGVCLGCSVENPQNAAGNNENDYSTLKMGIGVLGKIEQTLIFPQSVSKKLIIGIGSDHIPLSVSLLNGVTVETMNGATSNNDSKTIDGNILKIGTQTNKATIEFSPAKVYDRIRITMNGGLLNLSGGLRIYYAYYEDQCTIPFMPIHHYSFNGNTLDMPGGNINLVREGSHEETYSDDTICGQGLRYSSPDSTYVFKGNYFLDVPSPRNPRTVCFWARIEQGGSMDLTLYGEKIKITPDSIIIRPVNENHNFDKRYFGRMFRKNPATAGQFNFYVINFNNDPTPPYKTQNSFYKPNNETFPPYYPVDLKISVNSQPLPGPFNLFPAGNFQNDYPTTIYTTHWAPYYTQGSDLTNNKFIFSFKASQIDEFFIFDRKFYPEELLNAYSAAPANNFPAQKTLTNINETFTVLPNPTTGQITLDSNISMSGSEISIRNTSGMEVYRSAFMHKTFDLPAYLPDGIYMLTLQTKDKKFHTRKIILTR
ncbi:T9SS C-terminal target domain-containing protein [Chryseobacterium arthrosphaerae]|uniref:T9SS type A sorting domain-containing protein n=1 Tax=Chryseobacterium arthrosphaerae TaxID=651561 RepID=UPI000F4FD8AC|nr:T9SS type A sorting domain-containing protein [Chryseobacterium arthrosphaerae]AYZ14783.1 T9SS C-terminal target domain-containing protein [Chryseobacterium arthrosphaerae]